jgi:hypothetical protein
MSVRGCNALMVLLVEATASAEPSNIKFSCHPASEPNELMNEPCEGSSRLSLGGQLKRFVMFYVLQIASHTSSW